jgi:hypothetical protein
LSQNELMEQKATQNYSNDCEPVLINPIAARVL